MTDNLCEQCALRLFNDKCHNLCGVGNKNSGSLIIVPNVDYDAYKRRDMTFSRYVQIIQECISSTGGLDNVYIVPLIRCKTTDKCPINNDIINRCFTYTLNGIKRYDFNKIMLLGISSELFGFQSITEHINKLYLVNSRVYSVCYSPLIKFIDNVKFEVFKDCLSRWINSNKYNNYNGYEVIR